MADKNIAERKPTHGDLQKMLENIELRNIFNDNAIPECEAYRIARAKSYAQGKYHVFV